MASTTAVQKKTTVDATLAPVNAKLPALMVNVMQGLMPHVPSLLPQDISAEQFRAALYLELSGRPALAECTQESLRDCVIKAATYGLLPGRDVHFLPFSNRRHGGKKDATYVPNYFGVILALERTGKIRRAFAHPVHEGDTWEFDLFKDRPVHIPAATIGKKPGKELFYYGAVMFKDGTCAFEVVTLEDLDAIKKRAPSHENGPWVTDRVMMCRKSAIKRVAKYVKLTPELQGLLDEDEQRERADIAAERHQQNIVDLFGDETGRSATLPTPPPTLGCEERQGQETTPMPTKREGMAWDILREHQDDARLPGDMLERIAAALSPLAPASDSEAHQLADAVLAWLDNAEVTAHEEEA